MIIISTKKLTPAAHSALSSASLDLSGSVFLSALAEREEANRSGRMATIVFIRDYNSKGQEVSGYIDLAARLKVPPHCLLYRRSVLTPRRRKISSPTSTARRS